MTSHLFYIGGVFCALVSMNDTVWSSVWYWNELNSYIVTSCRLCREDHRQLSVLSGADLNYCMRPKYLTIAENTDLHLRGVG